VAGLAAAFGSGATTNSIREIRDADCVVVIGANTGEAHPVVSYEVVRAARRGATLIVIDPRRISLTRHAALHLRPAPGTDHALYLGMLHAIVANGWHNQAFIAERTEGFEDLVESLKAWNPDAASAKCGVPGDQIVEAARAYALGLRRAAPGSRADAGPRGNSTILYGMGITERSNGTELVKTLANLAMAAGQVGRPSAGIYPLRGQCNVQGGGDMGSLPNLYPGAQKVEDPEVRAKFARAWADRRSPAGRALVLPEGRGLTFIEMIRAASEGRIKAMYIVGQNAVITCPDSGLMERALRRLDFLVVQEIFPTETAQLAHVVLPAASFAEKSGTFVNLERRIQLLRPVLPPPGEARPDWEIFCEVGRRLGRRLRRPLRWGYTSAAGIMREIAALCPLFAGISHERLEDGGIQWPCPSPDHPGTPIMHRERFTRGRGRFHVTVPLPPFEPADEEYPLAASSGRILWHYNGGPMSRRSGPLDWRESRAYAEINPADAARAGVRDGQLCLLTSRRGSIRVQARVSDVVLSGMVYVPFHFREGAANVLTHAEGLDARAKTPEYKYCAVRLEPVRTGREPTAEHAPAPARLAEGGR
jgi:predicted molibdopterin-dependent oxidoreductase YjgC